MGAASDGEGTLSEDLASSAQQVEEKDYQGDHEQDMDKAAGQVEAESEKPQDENDNENCPEHDDLS
jgi:hypothetical protein